MNKMTEPIITEQPKPWWKRSRVKWFAGAVVLLVILGIASWWFLFRPYVSTNDARVATNILRVAPVGVGGVIEKVAAEEGDYVKAGQVLVEIDHRVPEAQLNKAQAKYDLARLELDRTKKLLASRSISIRDLDNAKMNFNIADAELKLASVNLENTYLKSPVDGIVIQKIAETGNVIEPGEVAIIISDVDHAWVSANIEETHVARLKIGQPVFITIDEGGTLTGRVQEITSATASQFSLLPAENASGNFTKVVQRIPVKISLDPHPGRILRTGQSVTVRIRIR
jgi:membrane fusion protein (multidrug efflux system)